MSFIDRGRDGATRVLRQVEVALLRGTETWVATTEISLALVPSL